MLVKEKWSPCFGLHPYVEVSTKGRFRRINKYYWGRDQGGPRKRSLPDKIWVPKSISPKGYPRINLGGVVYFVHRVVLETFKPDYIKGLQCNHIDGIKTNNCLSNLEWVTNLENRRHAVSLGLHAHGRRIINQKTWAKIRKLLDSGVSQNEAGKKFGFKQQTISTYYLREKKSIA